MASLRSPVVWHHKICLCSNSITYEHLCSSSEPGAKSNPLLNPRNLKAQQGPAANSAHTQTAFSQRMKPACPN